MNLLAHIGMRILEAMFFAGGIGSTVVLVLTAIEDVMTLTEPDDTGHGDAGVQ